jgi:colanic acid/amylovoran biosynthesis glycosyltransferase
MKIAYLINQYPQPSQTFIRREIAALESLGVTVERFTVRRWSGQLVDPRDVAERDRTTTILDAGPLGLLGATLATMFTRPARFFRAMSLAIRTGRRSPRGLPYHAIYLAEACVLLRRLGSHAGRGDPVRHLHAHFGTNSATVAMLCAALGGPRYSFTTHGPEEFDSPVALALGEKVRHAAFAIAISDFGRSQLMRWSDLRDWDKLHVVRCTVDSSLLDGTIMPPPDEPRLVCVARLGEQKGHQVLLDAAARLARQGVPFQLTLIGDGELRPAIEETIRRHDLSRHVRLAGWMSNDAVRDEIVRSRAMVLPSFAEGLPVVFMESLALGRPVITTWIAGTPELVQNGKTGWLVPPGAVDELADAMRAALTGPAEQLHQMGVAGREIVRKRHHGATEAAKLLELIRAAAEEQTTV